MGGTVTKIPGASSASFNEYYPTFSPDDQLIAFNRVAQDASSYNNPNAEVYVIPSSGNGPVRLAANDPPSCSGKTSPGVTNSWPKWSPGTSAVGTKQYYWLTFSSTRSANGNPQLYVTPVITQGNVISTFPALYLWNQPADEKNHTPAWDDFSIVQ
jgi:Tol biopolymer transport system component